MEVDLSGFGVRRKSERWWEDTSKMGFDKYFCWETVVNLLNFDYGFELFLWTSGEMDCISGGIDQKGWRLSSVPCLHLDMYSTIPSRKGQSHFHHSRASIYQVKFITGWQLMLDYHRPSMVVQLFTLQRLFKMEKQNANESKTIAAVMQQ